MVALISQLRCLSSCSNQGEAPRTPRPLPIPSYNESDKNTANSDVFNDLIRASSSYPILFIFITFILEPITVFDFNGLYNAVITKKFMIFLLDKVDFHQDNIFSDFHQSLANIFF